MAASPDFLVTVDRRGEPRGGRLGCRNAGDGAGFGRDSGGGQLNPTSWEPRLTLMRQNCEDACS
jgi:hypothetical protein